MKKLLIKTLRLQTQIETYESTEELKYPQKYEGGGVIIIDDSNKTEINDPRVQAVFKRSRHNNLSTFISSQDYYELPKKLSEANDNMYHIFKQNSFRDVRNLNQDKTSMDLTLEEFKCLS